jgi:hypothetical protein
LALAHERGCEADLAAYIAERLDTGAMLRIPEHPITRSDDIRSPIPEYPVTSARRG